jgi:ribosomal protein L35
MARQKTRKTAYKRVKKSNPKGNRKAKLMYTKTGQHHLKTKRSTRAKRRKFGTVPATQANERNLRKVVINL